MNNTEEMVKHKRSGSSLFLMEMIISIFIFIICGAICIKLFVNAHMINENTKALNHAVVQTESAAELYRNYNGDFEEVKNYYPYGQDSDQAFVVFYDENYEECQEENAVYKMQLINRKNIINNFEMKELLAVFIDKQGKAVFELSVEQ